MKDWQFRMTTAAGLLVAGVVVAVLGYLGVSRETEVAFQLPYFASAGVGSLLLVGAGATILLSTQLQRDSDRIEELEDAVRVLAGEVTRLADESASPRGDVRQLRGGRRQRSA